MLRILEGLEGGGCFTPPKLGSSGWILRRRLGRGGEVLYSAKTA